MENIKYSIFHTSFCGSTLLACLLSKSIETYSEPSWTIDIRNLKDTHEQVEKAKELQPNRVLIKYPSALCGLIPHIGGKQVFLYNNFEDHIRKLHQVTKDFDSSYEAHLWALRFLHASMSPNILYVQSKFLLENPKEVAKLVCNHFEIEYIPVEIDFHVKKAGYNNNDNPIKI